MWTKALKQLSKTLRKQTRKVCEKFPHQFSNVKIRVLWHDWLICEITCTSHENKKNTKGAEEEEEGKNCYSKFENERDFTEGIKSQ